jgi:hypothetical protein
VPVLGLADEIARDDRRVGGIVRDHADLGRPREDVDADLAEQRALGFRDELVARSDDDVGGLPREETVGERRDRLHAAERHDDVGAGDLHRVEDLRMDSFAAERTRARDHRRNARGLRGRDRHVRRGDMGVAPRRDIAAGNVDWDQALTGRQTWAQLGREFAHRFALRGREFAHLGSRELDVALHRWRKIARTPLDFLRRDEDLAAPLVEFLRVFAHRGLAAVLDRGEHLVHDLARACGLGIRILRCFLQVCHGLASCDCYFV